MLTSQTLRLLGATVLSLMLLMLAGLTSSATVAARDRDEHRYEYKGHKKNDDQWRKGEHSRFYFRRASFRRSRHDDDNWKHRRHEKGGKKWDKHKKHDRRHDLARLLVRHGRQRHLVHLCRSVHRPTGGQHLHRRAKLRHDPRSVHRRLRHADLAEELRDRCVEQQVTA